MTDHRPDPELKHRVWRVRPFHWRWELAHTMWHRDNGVWRRNMFGPFVDRGFGFTRASCLRQIARWSEFWKRKSDPDRGKPAWQSEAQAEQKAPSQSVPAAARRRIDFDPDR